MVYILSPERSPRLDYILDYIFHKRYKTTYMQISTIDEADIQDTDVLINYSCFNIARQDCQVHPTRLLFEHDIVQQNFHIHRWRKTIIPFYNRPGAEVPFDIFSAVFYYLSRYEEYVCKEKDQHGRFPVEQSISYQYKSLHQPVVDVWLKHFKALINKRKPIITHQDIIDIRPTFDIDLLYKYLHKSPIKTIGGALKDILSLQFKAIVERVQVLMGKKEDPYFQFTCIHDVLINNNRSAKYFLLMVSDTRYDRMHDLTNERHQSAIKNLNQAFPVSVHPSYYSVENKTIQLEKNQLEGIIKQKITASRQHFIKISWPDTYRQLLAAGITDDYTMGYPQHNGFRAGTSRGFYWFDLEKNEKTSLKIHPFSWMDATSLFYQKKTSLHDIEMEWQAIYHEVIKSDGIMCPIFHNYILGDQLKYSAYWTLFQKVMTG